MFVKEGRNRFLFPNFIEHYMAPSVSKLMVDLILFDIWETGVTCGDLWLPMFFFNDNREQQCLFKF